MPTINKRASIPTVRPSLCATQLTNAGIEVGDDRSECDDRQLDTLPPFGPLKGTGSMSTWSVTLFGETDVLGVFRIICWLWPEDNSSVW
jgi:hypothetical protein